MKTLFLIMTITLFAACSSEKNGVLDPSQNNGAPTPQAEVIISCNAWGDLQCQKGGDCENPVLNRNFDDLVEHFQTNFSPDDLEVKKMPVVLCGARHYLTWSNSVLHDPHESDSDFDEITLFLLEILDGVESGGCYASGPIEDKLNDYFLQTMEFKNECL